MATLNRKPYSMDKMSWLHFMMRMGGISILSPPKIVVISIIFLQLIFWVMYGHCILEFAYLSTFDYL
jgi:hypothetical protein